jgi:hypothetical protein
MSLDDYPFRNRLLNHVYKNFKFVLRNYYFKPLEETCLFFGLGPMYYGNVEIDPFEVGEDQVMRSMESSSFLRASERKIICSFRGRLEYSEWSPHHQSRKDLFELGIKMNESFPCFVEQTGIGKSSDSQYKLPYIDYLSKSIFALCPFGNSPETFRHYEALEHGAIPLLVRADQAYDYLSEIWGTDYPGPVFDTWEQAISFASTTVGMLQDIDRLQAIVLEWYENFKLRSQTNLRILIDEAFNDTNLYDNTKMASHFADKGFHYKLNIGNISSTVTEAT